MAFTKMYYCPICEKRTCHYNIGKNLWECEECGSELGGDMNKKSKENNKENAEEAS